MKELGPDVAVAHARRGESCDLELLRGQAISQIGTVIICQVALPGGPELAPRTISPWLGTQTLEDAQGGPQLVASVSAAAT